MNQPRRGTHEADNVDLWGVDSIARRFDDRSLSSVDLAAATFARISVTNPRLNAFLTLAEDQALEAAARADAERAHGAARGPLHGVPIGIKDAIDVADLRCTFGSRILADRRSAGDAECVRALRAAGSVIVGKQNLHEFAYGITSENPHYGDVRNPWDLERITGGSSGGTAAAIAAGMTPAGVGTDTGGSVRIPAALCGIVGLKPTYDLVSRAGVLPLAWSLDHVGCLASDVLGCFHLLDAMLGDGREPLRGPHGLADGVRRLAESGLSRVKVGIPREHFFEGVEPAVERTVRDAIDVFDGLGAIILDVAIPMAVHAQPVAAAIMGTEAASWHEPWLRERPDDYGRDVLLRLRQGALTRALDYVTAQKCRTLLRRDFMGAFQVVDVVVSPTVPIVAPLRGKTFEPTGVIGVPPRSVINRLTVPANLTGFPAITVPCGEAEGLPVGLQLMGPPYSERVVGALALAFESATEWHARRPIPVA